MWGAPIHTVTLLKGAVPVNVWRKPDGTPWRKPDGKFWLKAA